VVVIGIDPHKSSHTAAAVDGRSQLLAQLRLPTTRTTAKRLREWADCFPERLWAIEGANGLGRLLAQELVASGEQVVDVPAKLATRARLLQTGHGRKTDGIDARSVAVAALHGDRLRPVGAEDQSTLLRLLSDRRDELNGERRRTTNRLHRLLRDLVPGGAGRELTYAAAQAILRKCRPVSTVDQERKALARQLLADLRRLDHALNQNRRRCAQAVANSGSSLTEVTGISEVLAAKIIGHTGDIARFPSPAHYASYTGTAPIEASSGDVKRHRLSRAGNRSLNYALHMAARTQLNHPGLGRAYYERKLAEQKTPEEAFRSLKRQLAKVIYRHLRHDRDRPCGPAAS
jgi:transposase